MEDDTDINWNTEHRSVHRGLWWYIIVSRFCNKWSGDSFHRISIMTRYLLPSSARKFGVRIHRTASGHTRSLLDLSPYNYQLDTDVWSFSFFPVAGVPEEVEIFILAYTSIYSISHNCLFIFYKCATALLVCHWCFSESVLVNFEDPEGNFKPSLYCVYSHAAHNLTTGKNLVIGNNGVY